ncbi:MAG: transporter ATP-binding protein [Candidatus Doudnabacteria bacterium]|nr:transporter ATP-binding protein [Candidatus Doudnabacteria bacterium]
MNNYTLNKPHGEQKEAGLMEALGKLGPLLKDDKKRLILSGITGLVNAGFTLVAPLLVARVIDKYIQTGNFHGVLVFSGYLLALYIGAAIANYFQTLVMGTIGQNLLFKLRNEIFNKLQELPVAFFNQNKAGDLISRINNDTDKLNQFFARSLIQFVSGIISIVGAAVFVLVINWRLGLAMLAPAAILLVITVILSGWIKRKNAINLKSTGGMSAGIQENLENFKVVVAFNRRDYFREKFAEVNKVNYDSAVSAGIANNTLTPTYSFASSIAQLIIIAYGLYLITHHLISIGALISFLTYVIILYNPLRQMATIWSDFQTALAGWDRIHDIIDLQSDLVTVPSNESAPNSKLLTFKNVNFGYPDGKTVLHNVNFELERGKTYALVGPTGGGKTTTASLMARLYDPTEGTVFLDGKDIRSYDPAARTKKIGFILQEPFMFTGTIRDNILYGNPEYKDYSIPELEEVIKKSGLETLLNIFDQGLETKVSASGGTLSLGQKQLIAFIRAVLRNPELLILDEATANIDTVTEQLLEDILKKLPKETTRVIIAHRLNTIENADEIFFINGGEVTPAGSMEHAVEMLLHGNRNS